MASRGVPSVVALEVATARRSTKDTCGGPPADLRDEPREPAMGSVTHPRRTPQAWHRCRSDHGGEIYVEETAAPIYLQYRYRTNVPKHPKAKKRRGPLPPPEINHGRRSRSGP